MAKQIKEDRLVLIFETTRGETGPVEVSGRADYEVTSDDLTENRHYNLDDLSTGQINAIKGIRTAILAGIKKKEGV